MATNNNTITDNALSPEPVAPNAVQDTILRLLALQARREALKQELAAVEVDIAGLMGTPEAEAVAKFLTQGRAEAPRKRRSDAGKPRGPRKKAEVAAVEADKAA